MNRPIKSFFMESKNIQDYKNHIDSFIGIKVIALIMIFY